MGQSKVKQVFSGKKRHFTKKKSILQGEANHFEKKGICLAERAKVGEIMGTLTFNSHIS